MARTTVSVIIPVYNRRHCCADALRILKSQTLSGIEFIIIDDGSSDDTYQYLAKNTKSDYRFKIHRLDKNSGPSMARNIALDMAKGDYIGFFDIDDAIDSDYFRKLYQAATDNSTDIVFASYNNIKHKNTGVYTNLSDKISILRNGALWDKLFSRKMIEQNNIRFIPGLYCADNIFVFTAFYYARNVLTTNTPAYQYKLSSDSISCDKKKTEKRKSDILTVAQKITKFVSDMGFDTASRDQTYHFLRRTFNLYASDSVFCDRLAGVLSAICPNENNGQSIKKIKGKCNMFWLKLKKHLGIISSGKFDEILMVAKVRKSGLFDSEYYLGRYPDVRAAKMCPIMHYLNHGWREGRNPSPRFNNDAYLSDNPDVASANMCPLIHYIDHGQCEGRYVRNVTDGFKLTANTNDVLSIYKTLSKSKLFNKRWYLKTYPDVKLAKMNPIKHYISHGAREGRNPSKYFNTMFYLEKYPDVRKSGMNPLYHYIKFGMAEGRTAKTLEGKAFVASRTLKQKIKYAWAYPVRVHDEYHRLKDEIKQFKNGK